jgi:hypothetical protein
VSDVVVFDGVDDVDDIDDDDDDDDDEVIKTYTLHCTIALVILSPRSKLRQRIFRKSLLVLLVLTLCRHLKLISRHFIDNSR